MSLSKTAQQKAFIARVLSHSEQSNPEQPLQTVGQGSAPVNIALSKYWGKRDTTLNLPMNGSVSISLPDLGTQTTIELVSGRTDSITLNRQELSVDDTFYQRTCAYLDLFRPDNDSAFKVTTTNTVPTAAGLASSASGYAALVLALDDLFGWRLSPNHLSLLARLGSGSASRSLFKGFAQWHAGTQEDGMDSFAQGIDVNWHDLCIGLVKVDTRQKSVGSTQGMQNTVHNCELYQAWPQKAEKDKATIIDAIYHKDFTRLGETAENNALAMHATMIASWPPLLYWQAESVSAMHTVWQLRQSGIEVYFTMDAGPNLKLIMQAQDRHKISDAFAGQIQIIEPF